MKRRIAVPALFAAAAAGVAYALLRLRRGGPAARAGTAEPQEFRCACGERFHVAGADRHRIYWLPGASAAEPVLSGECPSCGRPLPRASHAGAGTRVDG